MKQMDYDQHLAAKWRNRRVLIIGLSQSGLAAAKLLVRLGAKVRVTEQKPQMACPEVKSLKEQGVEVLCGGHPLSVLDDIEIIVKNPGVTYRIALIKTALERSLEVITELEVGSSLLRDIQTVQDEQQKFKIISVTGSNGKTTTSVWLTYILENAGYKVVLAGNIGRPLADVILEILDTGVWPDFVVIEASSFQLKGIKHFRPDIAVLLNIVSAHLDYHGTMADYLLSKNRIFMNQQPKDRAILPALPELCKPFPNLAADMKAPIIWFGADVDIAGSFTRGEAIWLRDEQGKETKLLKNDQIKLAGKFNLHNAQAAAAAAMAAGCDYDAIATSLATFEGVPHRLKLIAVINGIRYYDDSKATNMTAVKNAIKALDGPILLIAGGVDRGEDFTGLVSIFKKRLRCIFAYGQAQAILMKRAEYANCQAYAVRDVVEAVEKSVEIACSGDVVLLSPGCASWDRYSSYIERGKVFQSTVHRLQQ